jgi:ABC-2 type transport system permease protein
MNKALIIARREYRAAVRTKGFLITLILLPIIMGGGLFVYTVFSKKVDLSDKKIAVIDYSGLFEEYLMQTSVSRNTIEIFDDNGVKIAPAYTIEIITPDTVGVMEQKLMLSERVRGKEIHAFATIGRNVMHPVYNDEQSAILYYAESSALDNVRGWFNNIINNRIRHLKILELGIDPEKVNDLFYWNNVEGMSLLDVDTRSGDVIDARKSDELQTILVPYVIFILLFMMLMMSAVPLLNAVMEEKSERIAEVLLGSVSPWQFMMGKILGGLAVSFTTAAIYIVGAVLTLRKVELGELIPYEIIPWFFTYMFLNIVMAGSIMAALGASCNDSKDAQAIQFPAMIPLITPMFLMMPIILNPLGKMATVFSLIPIWTPMLMLVRQSTSVTIPVWQIITGLVGIILFTIFCVWAGARIFRSMIIMQGKRPKLTILMKYIFKG